MSAQTVPPRTQPPAIPQGWRPPFQDPAPMPQGWRPPLQGPLPIPQGWRPHFQGPPPIPSGMNVNPQLWQAGRWQLNHAQRQARPSHQQSRSQDYASKNPFKGPIKPSAKYLATSLSDNPLGLTGMIPAEEYYAQQHDNHDDTAATDSPWIWNPPSLAPDEDDATEPSKSSTTDSPWIWNPPPLAPDEDDATEPSKSSTTDSPWIWNPPPLAPDEDDAKEPSKSSTDAFTAKRKLVPTFSVNIIRTPEHYMSSSRRRSSRGAQRLASKMENLLKSDSSQPQFIPPDVTDPLEFTPTVTGVPNLVEEPVTSPDQSIASMDMSEIAMLAEGPVSPMFTPLRLMSPESVVSGYSYASITGEHYSRTPYTESGYIG